MELLLAWPTRLPEDLFLGISRPGEALRSAIDPVPGVSKAGTLGLFEAEEVRVGSGTKQKMIG